MNDLWKIVVLIVKQMLQIQKPLFDDPKKIVIYVTDGIRETKFYWYRK